MAVRCQRPTMAELAGAAAAEATMQPIPNPPEKVVTHHHKAAKSANAATAPPRPSHKIGAPSLMARFATGHPKSSRRR
jgi:hypothetical protein